MKVYSCFCNVRQSARQSARELLQGWSDFDSATSHVSLWLVNVQVAMSARAWDTIDYSRVASVCMKNNKKKFEVRLALRSKLLSTLKTC